MRNALTRTAMDDNRKDYIFKLIFRSLQIYQFQNYK